MNRRTLIFVGVGVFLVALLLRTPAVQLQRLFGPSLAQAGVQFQGVEGSLSVGRATQIDLQGNPLVQDLGWNLRAIHLLLGRASFTLAGGRDGTLVDGIASIVPSGTLTLQDFRLASSLKGVLAAAGYAFMPVEGQLGLDLRTMKLRERWPRKAQGTLTVRGLGWKLGREAVLLGDYSATLDNETGGVKADITTLSGALEVSGLARLGDDRSYELVLQMRPRPNAPPMVPNLVRSLGAPDAQGWYHVRRKGQLGAPAEIAPAS
ncbi:MAG: type II secretion system protein N [Panacagrimonas sp.]